MTRAVKTRILIADDNSDFAAMLKLALEGAGYDVEVAANGHDALVAQRSAPADVLITDLVMPESDGLEAVAAFRREFPATRLVVVSGAERLATARYLAIAQLMGADAVLRKPFEIEALLGTLKSLA
jgi:CheY-like chemotaxis protein